MSAGQPTKVELKSATRLPTSLFIPKKIKIKIKIKINSGLMIFKANLATPLPSPLCPKSAALPTC